MATGLSNSEKSELKSRRINGEGALLGVVAANPERCYTCVNSLGEPPWADKPTKSYCLAYPREEGLRKPPDVYYNGADCPFYRQLFYRRQA